LYTSIIMNTTKINDEINLIEYFKIIFRHKLALIITVFICLLLCITYNKLTQKLFRVHTTFFITSSKVSNNSLPGSLKLFTGMGSSDIENYLIALTKSRRIQEQVALQLKPKYYTSDTTSTIIDTLRLEKKVKIKMGKNKIFKLSYQSTNPEMAYNVIHEYLQQITILNQELEITSSRRIITILDKPRIPIYHFSPNAKMNLFVTIILSSFLGICGIFLYNGLKKKPS
jgi:uncharacterized protein involved in exopolysaccharide biosynthesis